MPVLVASRYRLGEPVGRGGMGRVWRAHDQVLDREVAVKEIVPPPAMADPEGVHRRTLREARATARLSHPGVVRVFDVLEVDGGTWIVMEYVPSRSLQEVMAAEGPLPPRRVAKIGLDLLAALVAANKAGVEHRDVKPANVLIADDGRVMLTDFGIAAIADDPSTSTSDALIGSPEYMPPERAQTKHFGLASDLWSLGATLYAAVEGQSPFRRATVAATLTALTVEPPETPTHAEGLAPVLMALLQKDPTKRPSARETAKMLRSAASGAYGRASIPASDVRDETAPAEDPAVPDPSTPRRKPAELAEVPAVPSPSDPVPSASSPSAPDPSAPDPSAPDPSAPGSAAPSPSAPGSAAPSPSAPSPSAPGSAAPGSAAPSTTAPSTAAPSTAAPGRNPAELAEVAAVPSQSAPRRNLAELGEDPAVPGPSAPRRKWAVAAAIVLSILLIAGATFWLFNHQSKHGPAAARQTSPPSASTSARPSASLPAAPAGSASASAPASPSTKPSSSSSSSGLPALPSGWHDYHDKTGFSVYLPNGWTYSKKDTMVYFRGDGRTVGIDQSDHPKSDPLADWKEKAAYRVPHGDFPGYHLIRMESVKYLYKSADWEYTFNGSGGRQHVDNRNILASSKQAYAIYWETSDAQWSSHKDDLALIYASFRPK